MSKIDQILNEKFGFTKNLPSNKQPNPADMHDWVTNRNGRGSYTAGGHPMEKYREEVKAMLHALDTGDQALLERAIDFEALKRLTKKHGLKSTLADGFNTIQASLDSKKYDEAIEAWNNVRKEIPWWFLGMVGKREPDNEGNVRELPEDEKEALTNLRDVMDQIKDVSGKEFKRAADGTPKQTQSTEAKKNLDKARKDAGIKKEEDLNKKYDNMLKESDEK
jgi:hypothetical protein